MLHIRLGDPHNFATYLGQESLKRRLLLRLNAMKKGESFRALFYAPAGQGKTALVRVLAREMHARGLADYYFETTAGKFESKDDLDRFITKVPAYSIVFIDEIHGLPGIVRDALYPAIQDGIYVFNEAMGPKRLPEGIHWIGATIDLGKVHPALQRRLMPMGLEELSLTDKVWLALLLPRKVDSNAAVLMAERSRNPWELKDELYVTAADIVTERKSWEVTLEHVLEACNLLRIDENGLRPKERAVLEALHNNPRRVKGGTVYAMAKTPLVTMIGVDDATFTAAIEPNLIRLGFLTLRSGVGRALTDKALKAYFHGKNS